MLTSVRDCTYQSIYIGTKWYKITEFHTGTRITVYQRAYRNSEMGWLPIKQIFVYWWEYRPTR